MPKIVPSSGAEPQKPYQSSKQQEDIEQYLILKAKAKNLQNLNIVLNSLKSSEIELQEFLKRAEDAKREKIEEAEAAAVPGAQAGGVRRSKQTKAAQAGAATPTAPPTSRDNIKIRKTPVYAKILSITHIAQRRKAVHPKVAAAEAAATGSGSIPSTLQEIEKEIAALEKDKGAYQQTIQLLKTLLQYLKDPGSINANNLPQFLEVLLQLQQSQGSLPPDLQKVMSKIYSALQKITIPGTNQDFADLLAAYLINKWSQEYYILKPANMTVQQYIQQQEKQYGLNTSIPFFNNVSNDINTIMQTYPIDNNLGIDFRNYDVINTLASEFASIPESEMSKIFPSIQAAYKEILSQEKTIDKELEILNDAVKYNPPTVDTAYEISYLQQLIAMLQKDLPNDPSVQAKLKKYLATLATLQKDYPNLTPDQITSLQNIFNSVNSIGSQLPDNQQQAFIQTEMSLFKTMISVNTTNISELEQEINSYNTLASAEAQIKDIYSILATMGSGGILTPAQYQKLINDIQSLTSEQSSLPDGAQGFITTTLNYLSTLNFSYQGKNFNFADLIADGMIYSWQQQYYASTTDPTQQGLIDFLKQKISQFQGNAGSNTFTTDVLNELNADVSGYPTPADGQGILSFTDPDFFTDYTKVLATLSGGQAASEYLAKIAGQIQTFLDDSKSTIDSLNKTINTYNSLNQIYQQATDQLMNNLIWVMPLQQAFATVILDYYMPQQESYLNTLAGVLNYTNEGSSMDNAILEQITGFGNAGSLYNLYSYFSTRFNPGPPSYYSGTITDGVTAAIAAEIEALEGDGPDANGNYGGQMGQIQKAIATINAQIAQIQQDIKDGKLTPTQGANLINELKTTQTDLNKAFTNMQTLLGTLSNIKVVPVYDSHHKEIPNEFNLEDQYGNPININDINTQETALTQGSADDGGIVQIQHDVQANQTQWSSQSQTNQMNLQLVMTEIQQEWAIVSSSLTALNQMYLTFARGILGH